MFWVGQKVVCVDADARNCPKSSQTYWEGDPLRLDAVYTVDGFETVSGYPTLLLREAKNKGGFHGVHQGYVARRFRPLTDISVFQALLTVAPTPKLIEENA